MTEQEKLTLELLESQNTSFLGSVDENGFPQVRAMLQPRKWEGVKTIYFSTNTPTNKVQHYKANEKACVYLCDPQTFRGALLIGTVEVLEDQEHKDMLWKQGDEMYYPGGVTDPGYCVLRFTATHGRNYSNFQSVAYMISPDAN